MVTVGRSRCCGQARCRTGDRHMGLARVVSASPSASPQAAHPVGLCLPLPRHDQVPVLSITGPGACCPDDYHPFVDQPPLTIVGIHHPYVGQSAAILVHPTRAIFQPYPVVTALIRQEKGECLGGVRSTPFIPLRGIDAEQSHAHTVVQLHGVAVNDPRYMLPTLIGDAHWRRSRRRCGDRCRLWRRGRSWSRRWSRRPHRRPITGTAQVLTGDAIVIGIQVAQAQGIRTVGSLGCGLVGERGTGHTLRLHQSGRCRQHQREKEHKPQYHARMCQLARHLVTSS